MTPSPNCQPLLQQPGRGGGGGARARDSFFVFNTPTQHTVFQASPPHCAFLTLRAVFGWFFSLSCLIVHVGLPFLQLQSGGRGGAVGGRLIKELPAAACSPPFWRKAFNTAARQRSKPLSRHWEGDSITILLEPRCLKPSQKKEGKKKLTWD